MLHRKLLPKNADIFVMSKHYSWFSIHHKPINFLQALGVMIIAYLLLFDAAILIPPLQKNVSEAETANSYPQIGRDTSSWDNGGNKNNTWYTNNTKTVDATTYTPFPSNNSVGFNTPTKISPISPEPLALPTVTLTSNTTPPLQPIQPIQPVQPNENNIAAISAQIVAEQQQISGLMQRCVTNAQLMANQIIGLKNQQKQLQNEISALQNQAQNIDTSTQAGQNQQNAINNRIQQLQQQSDNLGTTINNDQNNLNNANGQCQQQVGQLEQQRGNLESNLDNTFNQDINIQIPD